MQLGVDRTGSLLPAANYGSGSLECFRRNQDGSLGAAQQHFQYEGHGLSPQRQSGPRTHGSIASSDNRFMLVNDLGLDKIMVYSIHPVTFRLTPNDPPGIDVNPGSGPRHSIFHPNNRWVFSINELDCTVTTLGWHAARGTLTLLSTAKILPEGHNSYLEQMRTSGPTVNQSAPQGGVANTPPPAQPAAPRGNAAAEVCVSRRMAGLFMPRIAASTTVSRSSRWTRRRARRLQCSVSSRVAGLLGTSFSTQVRGEPCCAVRTLARVVFNRDVKTGKLSEHHRYALPGAGTTVFRF